MFSVLRVSSSSEKVEGLLKFVEGCFPDKSKINRQNDLVIDLSKSKDWDTHCLEIKENIDVLLKVFPKNTKEDYELILDISVDKPEISDDDSINYCVYNFDLNFLRKLASNEIELEVTIY